MSELKRVTIWTDGACRNNPGPGGYAAILVWGEHRRELSAGFRQTTNNRMELMAVIAALRALRCRCAVTVYSDARYVVDGVMNGTMRRWRAGGWLRAGQVVPNADLWEQLHELCQTHEVTFTWVKGHAGAADNERCDWLALQAAQGPDLHIDEGYENRDRVEAACAPTLFDGPHA